MNTGLCFLSYQSAIIIHQTAVWVLSTSQIEKGIMVLLRELDLMAPFSLEASPINACCWVTGWLTDCGEITPLLCLQEAVKIADPDFNGIFDCKYFTLLYQCFYCWSTSMCCCIGVWLSFFSKHAYLLWRTHSHCSHKEERSQGRYRNLGKTISRTEQNGLGSHRLHQRAVDEKRIICKCNITNHQAFSSIYITKTYKCSATFWCVRAFRLNGQTYQSITELLCMKWKYSAEFALFSIWIAYLMSSPPHKSLLHTRTGHQRTGRCRCNH